MNYLPLWKQVEKCKNAHVTEDESIVSQSGTFLCTLLNIYQQGYCPHLSVSSQVYYVRYDEIRGREYPICRKTSIDKSTTRPMVEDD